MSLHTMTRFYEAFAAGDADAMADLYHPDITFEDPVFGKLDGPRVMAMWRMLIERSRGHLQIRFENARIEGDVGRLRWIATYPFSKTGRLVVNRIEAEMRFRDGRIVAHRDRFSFWRWSRQALGLPGWVLGWTPLLRNKVSAEALKGLAMWERRRG